MADEENTPEGEQEAPDEPFSTEIVPPAGASDKEEEEKKDEGEGAFSTEVMPKAGENKPDDQDAWVTAPMKQAPASKPSVQAAEVEGVSPPPATPEHPKAVPAETSSAQKTTPSDSFEVPPSVSAASAESGGPKSIDFMANLGVDNPQTQRIILFGGGGVILLCCLCSCVALGLALISGGL
ncbi:MAG: hypothetical protein GYB64_10330 [Chloroflexi bacterium]|nr:hypothetical protein [Chloroflexota bacterium]